MITDLITLERPLVVLDAEMTGAIIELDRIVQLGLVIIKPNGEFTSWKTLLNPGIPIPPEVTEIHGITDAMVADAPKFDFLADRLHALLMGSDVAGYNVSFDLKFIAKEYQLLKREFRFTNYVIDSHRIYQVMYPRTLVAARKDYLGEDEADDDAHDALVDAEATIRVLRAQLLRHEQLPRTVSELHELCVGKRAEHLDAQGKFAWRNGVCILNFGNKHRGTPLDKVPRSYLTWMLNAEFEEDTKAIVRQALIGQFPKKDDVCTPE